VAEVRPAFAWVHEAAHVLANHDQQEGTSVRIDYDALLATMAREREHVGSLTSAVDHFLKVTASYRPGLFHCYDVPDLPRTNNDLEHTFGSVRHLERRATGRKVASPSLVLCGSVRVVAALVTRSAPITAPDLQPRDLKRWRTLRADLEVRHAARRAQARFRRDPSAYLSAIESELLKQVLPS
jgi:hypothetical protein